MFFLSLLLYIDRICISVAKEPIARELALSDKAMGWVLSAFALGYALLQVPSGALADRWGPRRVLASIVTFWSGMTALTGAAWNYASLLVFRFLFGAGEAGAFPGMSRAIYSWFPLRERGMILGINFSGSRLGAAFALPLVAWLITAGGWRLAFVLLGGIGLVWALLWWLAFRDTPEAHPRLPAAERDHIVATRQAVRGDQPAGRGVAVSTLLRSGNMWRAIGQYFASNFTFFFTLTWLFPYLQERYDLDAVATGWYAVLPLLCGAIGNWTGGGLVDLLYRRGQWNASRRLPAILGFALAAAGLIGLLYMQSPLGAVLMLSLAIFGADMTLPPSWALCVDIGQTAAGKASGLMNMAGNLGSFLTALAFPYLLAWTGASDYFFYTAALLNVAAIFLWLGVRAERGLD